MYCPMKFNTEKLPYDTEGCTWECEEEKCAWWREYHTQYFNESTQAHVEADGNCAILDIAIGQNN